MEKESGDESPHSKGARLSKRRAASYNQGEAGAAFIVRSFIL
jgi:hypothetical protein